MSVLVLTHTRAENLVLSQELQCPAFDVNQSMHTSCSPDSNWTGLGMLVRQWGTEQQASAESSVVFWFPSRQKYCTRRTPSS